MIIAFPSQEDKGEQSAVYGHFGSAEFFVFVDTRTDTVETIPNADKDHQHGLCQPIKALDGRNADAIAVGGIGKGALKKLSAAGIKVYRAVEGTVAENAALVKAGRLPEFMPGQTCGGHGIGGGCSH